MIMAEDAPGWQRMQRGGGDIEIDRILHDGDEVTLGGEVVNHRSGLDEVAFAADRQRREADEMECAVGDDEDAVGPFEVGRDRIPDAPSQRVAGIAVSAQVLLRGLTLPPLDRGIDVVHAAERRQLRFARHVADEHGVALVMLHHLRKEGTTDPIDSVSGTAGLTGALDTIIVLKRQPNDPHGILYVRGRDVHETETALQFDKDTGKWLRLGAGDDFRKSQERRAVIRALADAGPMTPTELAAELGKRAGTMRVLLLKMVRSGDVEKHMDGRYGTPMLI